MLDIFPNGMVNSVTTVLPPKPLIACFPAGQKTYSESDIDFAPTSGLDRFGVDLDEWRLVRDRVNPERVFASDLARRLRLVTGLRH